MNKNSQPKNPKSEFIFCHHILEHSKTLKISNTDDLYFKLLKRTGEKPKGTFEPLFIKIWDSFSANWRLPKQNYFVKYCSVLVKMGDFARFREITKKHYKFLNASFYVSMAREFGVFEQGRVFKVS